jgi:serine/threonine protein phosphatase PrpC
LLLALLYLFLFAAVRAGIGHVTQHRAKRPGGFTVTVTQGPSELMGTTLPVSGPLVIGRSPGADIVIGDDFVSGRHARISPVGADVVLEDLDSTNGTFLNGARISAAQSASPRRQRRDRIRAPAGGALMSSRATHDYAAVTDIGRVRSHNEDSILAQPPLFVVADGLGGHEAGEVASSIAIETVRDHAPKRADAKALGRAVRAANREVIRAAGEGIGRTGMGTTLTAAIVEGTRIAVAHVGDSRAYLLHGTQLQRVTEDHSMVADLVRRGEITEQESRVHPNRSIITRALGSEANMEADVLEVEASEGDRLLLCSDGLTGMLDDAAIARILGQYRDPEVTAHALVAAANEGGGQDNISVVIVDIGDTQHSRRTRKPNGCRQAGPHGAGVGPRIRCRRSSPSATGSTRTRSPVPSPSRKPATSWSTEEYRARSLASRSPGL